MMHSKFDKAINFFENGNLNESKKLCLEILKDEPKNFDILHLSGIILFQLKNNRNTKLLFNTQVFARNIEKAYSLMYERYLKNLPLDNIEIN